MATPIEKEKLKELVKITYSSINLADQDDKHFVTAYIMAKKTISFLKDSPSLLVGVNVKQAVNTSPIKVGEKFFEIQNWFNKADIRTKLETIRSKLQDNIEKKTAEIKNINNKTKDVGVNLEQVDVKLKSAEDKLTKALGEKSLKSSNLSRSVARTEDEVNEANEANEVAEQATMEFQSARAKANTSARSAPTKVDHLKFILEKLENDRSKLLRQLNLFEEVVFKNLIVEGATDKVKTDMAEFIIKNRIEDLEKLIQQFKPDPPARCSGFSCFGRGGGRTRRKKAKKGRKTRRKRR
jgi:hypothetical protein